MIEIVHSLRCSTINLSRNRRISGSTPGKVQTWASLDNAYGPEAVGHRLALTRAHSNRKVVFEGESYFRSNPFRLQ
ncbi:hypothetical protein PM082_019204 [Marasmius tenuissimus]|nr:hypothetical protein PM082_019204 [Marasmius tenuissimus]